ncbi:MAG: hypothetical protein AAF941_05475 [Pseudomonadota bacterium]
MNHEARKALLERLTTEVHAATSNCIANGVPEANTHDRNELNRKISNWMQRGEAIRRDLEANLAFRKVSAPRASLAKEGYRASRGRQDKQERAVRDAWYAPYAEFSAAIAKLTGKVLGPKDSARAIIKTMEEGLGQITKSLKSGKSLQSHELSHVLQQGKSAVATIQAAPAPHIPTGANPIGGPVSPIGILMVGLSLLAALKTRFGRDR